MAAKLLEWLYSHPLEDQIGMILTGVVLVYVGVLFFCHIITRQR